MLLEEWNQSIHEKDGISKDKERQMRFEVVSFMTYYGIFFKLPQISIAKGIVIFHQVSMQISFKKFDRLLYGAVCMFIASKLDDHPKPIKEFIRAYDYMYNIHKKQIVKNVSNPYFEPSYSEITEEGYKAHFLDFKRQSDLDIKFCNTEIEVLKLIGYDLVIELPYQYLDIVKKSPIIPDANFLKIANNFINDSMRTIACLYYEPRIIALAALNLAASFCNYKFPNLEDQKAWYKCLGDDIEMELVTEVTLHIMEIYKRFTFLQQ